MKKNVKNIELTDDQLDGIKILAGVHSISAKSLIEKIVIDHLRSVEGDINKSRKIHGQPPLKF
ncbi:hypothetical protein [Flexithrix dorotheae]|uniref:hypothetical protein n=1 Tax=Flexithrix dorotheae TaxID=70993 RepID=UPI0003716BCD|nr:hypothetical protein [Flexithrix dorotheae]